MRRPAAARFPGDKRVAVASEQIRSSCGLPSLAEDPESSLGAALHARYLVKTYGDRMAGDFLTLVEGHGEIVGSPGHISAGASAAGNGDEAFNNAGRPDPTRQIETPMESLQCCKLNEALMSDG